MLYSTFTFLEGKNNCQRYADYIAIQKCVFHGLLRNLKKTGHAIFTRKQWNHYVPPLLFGEQLRVDRKVKYLGAICLTGRPHVKDKMRTAINTF